MTRRFRTEPEAAAELEDAAAWYESQRAGLGLEFIAAVDATFERIDRWPQAAPYVHGIPRELGVRKAPVGSFPYSVAYLDTPSSVRILAFAHERREPGYWHARLTK
jgi:plasmid stabilization system protein ParE